MRDDIQVTAIKHLAHNNRDYKPALSFHYKTEGLKEKKLYMVQGLDGSCLIMGWVGHLRGGIEADLKNEFNIDPFKVRHITNAIKFKDAYALYHDKPETFHKEFEQTNERRVYKTAIFFL